MSRYIKLDTAIEHTNQLYHGDEVEAWLESLPTIEVSEDAISRATVLEIYSDLYWTDERLLNFKDELDKVYEKLRTAPSVTPQVPNEDAISRGNLISELAGIWDTYTPNNMIDFQDMLEDIDYKIRNAPSVAPKPKEGQWIDIGLTTHSYKCSVCGRMLVNITDGKKTVAKNYPYCHCGAKMKGAE